MNEDNRGILTIGLWFLSTIVLAALFIAAAAQGELTATHAALASVIIGLVTIGTISIWRMKDSETQQEKMKRRNLDSLLHDLSDDELAELKHRLMGEDSDGEVIMTYLEGDGEIRHRG